MGGDLEVDMHGHNEAKVCPMPIWVKRWLGKGLNGPKSRITVISPLFKFS